MLQCFPTFCKNFVEVKKHFQILNFVLIEPNSYEPRKKYQKKDTRYGFHSEGRFGVQGPEHPCRRPIENK